jgi:hypothetical protein
MLRIRRLIVLYFMLAGIAAHLVLFGVWLAWPQLVWRAEERAMQWLERQGITTSTAVASSDPLADLRAAVPPWEPASGARLAAGEIRVNGASAIDLADAARRLQDGALLELGPAVYKQGLIIKANGVTLRGHGQVVFDDAAVKGKGALLIQGNDTRVANIECRNIKVKDRNGACIRLQGRNLTLDHVYFHSSEQGVLTGGDPGQIIVTDSRFELLGKGGRAHGLYIGGGELIIRDSLFLSSVGEGHEIKSRAGRNIIERSVVASLGGADSRLIDISNGGELIVRDSVLQEGPGSVNSDMIGFALEKKRQHEAHHVELTNNIILLEGRRKTRLLHQRDGTPAPLMEGNVIIGAGEPEFAGMNVWLTDREEAGLAAYPALPAMPRR